MLRPRAHLLMCLALSGAALAALTTPAHAQEAVSATADIAAHTRGLSDRDPHVRIEAARALGALGDRAAESALTQTLRFDPVPQVRGWAARALMQLDTPAARATVGEAVRRDADERVRTLCAELTAPAAPAAQPATPFDSAGAATAAPQGATAGQATSVEARVVVTVNPGGAARPAAVATPQVAQPAPVVVAAPAAAPQVVQAAPVVVAAPTPQSTQAAMLAMRLELRQQRRLRARGVGFVIVGWTMFGLSYLGSLVSIEDGGAIAALPLIGGFIAAAQVEDTYSADELNSQDDMKAGLILSSVIQITGFALAVIGHARRRQGRRMLAQRVAIVPTLNGLAGRF